MAGATTQPPTALDSNVHQGFFGESFVAVIAAAAGFDVDFPRLGHAIDFSISARGPKGTSRSRKIDVQVKTWAKPRYKGETLAYPLEVSAYNNMCGSDHDVRQYVVLCLVPEEYLQYADANHRRMRLQRSAYWFSLREQEPDFTLPEGSSKTIFVPTSQLLTVLTLQALVHGNEQAAVVDI